MLEPVRTVLEEQVHRADPADRACEVNEQILPFPPQRVGDPEKDDFNSRNHPEEMNANRVQFGEPLTRRVLKVDEDLLKNAKVIGTHDYFSPSGTFVPVGHWKVDRKSCGSFGLSGK